MKISDHIKQKTIELENMNKAGASTEEMLAKLFEVKKNRNILVS